MSGRNMSGRKMRYIHRCTRCLLPETKPGLTFDEKGVCSACRNYENRENINWDERWSQLQSLVDEYRNGYESYNCLIPVSGGKDSFFQVNTILKLGLRPLLVTATTCHPSELGKQNLSTLQGIPGVDSIQITPDREVRRRMNVLGLRRLGDISWPEHVSIFTTPVKVAVNFGIPLIIWGENPQNEYGTGSETDASSFLLDKRWVNKHGGLLGLTPEALVDFHHFSYREILPYVYPAQEEIDRLGVRGIFLGQYVPWDGFHNKRVAEGMGFKAHRKRVEGSACDYENLDNLQTGIHDYFKWLKYGFGRATDICSSWIRRGYISREQGKEIVRDRDGMYPSSYLDVPLAEILDNIGVTKEQFDEICEKHTNKEIHL